MRDALVGSTTSQEAAGNEQDDTSEDCEEEDVPRTGSSSAS